MSGPRELIAEFEAAGVWVALHRSTAPDGALVVQIDTTFEPNGSDAGPGLRVRVNDANVTECTPADFVALGEETDE